jgi:AraC-like DNA-binding protein
MAIRKINDMRSRETRVHSFDTKPFSYYECIIPDHFNSVPMHWHSEFEINYIRKGSSEFICADERFTAHAGDIIVTQPNVLHSIYPYKDSRQIYDTLVFSSDIFGNSDSDRYINECIKPLVNGSMKICIHITENHCYYFELRKITENIFSCAKGNTPQLDMLMRSELIRFFWLLETQAETDMNIQESNEIIRPALEYIADNFGETITVKQLADTVHLSESYFMNQFRKYVGLSAVEYINQFRVNQACKDLIDTQKNISEIAFDCGFRNLSNFNRQFSKITGCSPSEYRKKLRLSEKKLDKAQLF